MAGTRLGFIGVEHDYLRLGRWRGEGLRLFSPPLPRSWVWREISTCSAMPFVQLRRRIAVAVVIR